MVYLLCRHTDSVVIWHTYTWVDPEWGAGGPDPPPPLKNHEKLGFLSNTVPDPLKNRKATEPEINVGPSSARQRNAI